MIEQDTRLNEYRTYAIKIRHGSQKRGLNRLRDTMKDY